MIEQHNDSLLKELARLSQALINSLTDIQLPQMVGRLTHPPAHRPRARAAFTDGGLCSSLAGPHQRA